MQLRIVLDLEYIVLMDMNRLQSLEGTHTIGNIVIALIEDD